MSLWKHVALHLSNDKSCIMHDGECMVRLNTTTIQYLLNCKWHATTIEMTPKLSICLYYTWCGWCGDVLPK